MKDSIGSAHRRLDGFLETLGTALTAGDEAAARETFAQLREALEGHFDQEDHLYYPSIRSLRPELEASVERFATDHAGFRRDALEIQGLLDSGSCAEALRSLERFGHAFTLHEAAEEKMLQSLDQELTA